MAHPNLHPEISDRTPPPVHIQTSPPDYVCIHPTALDPAYNGPARPPSPVVITAPALSTNSTTAVGFIANHTTPSTPHSNTDDCPICLDSYTTENCLQITGITGCKHRIGSMCLRKLLNRHPGDEKKCPLCRTVWIPGVVSNFAARDRSLANIRAMTSMLRSTGGEASSSRNRLPYGYTAYPIMTTDSQRVVRTYTQPSSLWQPRYQSVLIDSSEEAEDRDSEEEDYATQVRNYEDLTAHIADIRRRADNLVADRTNRNRRQDQLQHGHESQSRGGSETNRVGPRRRRGAISANAPGANVLNRFMNVRALNAFRTAVNGTALEVEARGDRFTGHVMRGMARARDEPNAGEGQHRATPGEGLMMAGQQQDTISSAEASVSLNLQTHTRRAGADVEVTGSRSSIPQPHTRISHSFRTPEARAQYLDERERFLDVRYTNLLRWETALQEREMRAENTLALITRQRSELEALLRRQREELESR
ncbi:hypothetical protein COCHEDRAFT_1160509 [Bipolaris maydis C5]|uniref:RING-type domain-containing protein n=1 Tax=Cochliobolus heterostrophus (strain C5 / ATCC 48332 / race O) TaxID=701091 RepID=M2UE78_COCH5|nr:hypothetical protein COCHEDRAFT_1160509 [Bipolaris maydis C5]KAH7551648.1 hypothetical protein BM1_09282 [Bipolaris maydis]KAJ6213835.1 hypothetical protein PSV09DRAFT_1160509 [Bipolaris maydis]